MERAERLRRLQELKANMAKKQGAQDQNHEMQIVMDDRTRQLRQSSGKKRHPSAKGDVIYRNENANVKVLYQDNSLPAIHH